MANELLNNINKNQNKEIDLQEIQDFSRNNENIQQIKETLKQQEKSELLASLETSLNNAIGDILSRTDLLENDIKILDLWNKLLGDNYPDIMNDVNKKIKDINSKAKTLNLNSGLYIKETETKTETKISLPNMIERK
jgi:hypothetical protein